MLLGIAAGVGTAVIWFGAHPVSLEKRLLMLLVALILAGIEPIAQAWDNRQKNRKGEYLHETGVALNDLIPDGKVKIRGEIWKARSYDGNPISSGSRVKTARREGLTLIVARE